MSDRPVIDLAAARERKSKKSGYYDTLADYALGQCEQSLIWCDWQRFGHWLQVYQHASAHLSERRSDSRKIPSTHLTCEPCPTPPERRDNLAGFKEAMMRCVKICAILVLVVLSTPVPAQPLSHSTSNEAKVIASTSFQVEAGAGPLYIKLFAGKLRSDEISADTTSSGIFYQFSGATEISIDGLKRATAAGEGVFIARGARVKLRALGEEPSVFLQFVLSSVAYSGVSDFWPVDSREIYRSSAPIPALKTGRYRLDLRKVILPHMAPADLPHHRSGVALHYVISGFGSESANGVTVLRSPGSVSYEPSELVYQWGNPGGVPLTYLVFNLNPEGESAVIADATPHNR